jgi:hypothetical protein
LCGKKVSWKNAIDDIDTHNMIYRILWDIPRKDKDDININRAICKKCLEKIA